MQETTQPRICDYEGSDYRTRFWEGQGRDYEDTIERHVLRQMLPESGKRLLEIGAGFGRLTNEYDRYEKVVLLDYSFSQLQYAREHFGDERYIYVAADAYKLPFKQGVFDGATMIRVLHHFENVPAVLRSIRQVMSPLGTFILEYASKRNLKAILRHAMGRQPWSPFELPPVEFVELNFNFHPTYIQRELQQVGFIVDETVPVSFFRLGILKRTMPTSLLVTLDSLLQRTGWQITPAIFTKNLADSNSADNLLLEDIFACPETGADLRREGDLLINPAGTRWQIRDGIYDFKTPVA